MSVVFENAYQDLARDANWTPGWVGSLREQSYLRFQELGLPKRQNEDWKYTSTRSLAEATFQSPQNLAQDWDEAFVARLALADSPRLVFVNGAYRADQSLLPEGISVLPLQDALVEKQDLVLACLNADEDSLSVLNQACFSSGVFLTINKDTKVLKPLQLLFVQTSNSSAAMISPRNIIFVEAGARVSILESHVGISSHFTNAVTDVFVKERAHCEYILERALGPETQYVSKHNFHVSRDARVESFNLALGGKLNRSHLEFRLTGPGAFAKLDGLYITREENHIDSVTEVLHLAPHTSSSQVYKGILEGRSRAVFNGKITIVKDAQQVTAHQLNKNLLMSPDAEVDSRPQLTIDANDVKCSHGATIGQIDEQELFYLQSRAISRDDAKRMLAQAFVGDVVGRISSSSLAKHVQNTLHQFEEASL